MILSNLLWIPEEQVFNGVGLKNSLRVSSKFDNKEAIQTCVEKDGYYGIPRNFSPVPKEAEDQTVLPKPCDFSFTGELRPVQEEMLKDWQRMYSKGKNDWIINADTGVGKTILMIKIACELKVPFLVIVPLERLMTYWIDQIKKFTTIKEVGIVRQKDCQYKDYFASVGLVHSVCKDKYSEDFKNHFGLIIYDELHQYGSEHFSTAVSMFPARHRLGASATLKRQDGMENVYYFHLGKNIITTEIKTQPKPKVLYCYNDINCGKYPAWLDRYDPIKVRAFLLSMLAKNKKRNNLIAGYALALAEKGLQTLVIGDRIAQLEEIQEILVESGHENNGLYIGKTPSKEKKHIEKNCSVILATMKMLETGIDIDTLRGLIFATPKSNVTQVVGRIRRINPDVPDPVVIDIVDNKYKETRGWFNKRKEWYKKENFKMIEFES